MTRSGGNGVVGGLLVAWLAVFVLSFVVPQFVAPSGEGFVRGLNRLVWWFWIQVGATGLAMATWLVARRQPALSPGLRRLSRVPIGVTVVLVVGVGLVIYGAAY